MEKSQIQLGINANWHHGRQPSLAGSQCFVGRQLADSTLFNHHFDWKSAGNNIIFPPSSWSIFSTILWYHMQSRAGIILITDSIGCIVY